MKQNILNQVSGLATVAISLVTMIIYWQSHKHLSQIALVVFVIGVGFIYWVNSRVTMYTIRKSIAKIHQKIGGFKPDIIISLNRSGSVIAGMYCVNYDVEELISVNRKKILDETKLTLTKSHLMGESLTFDQISLSKKKILILFLVIDKGETLREGMEFLKKQGISSESKIKVATIFISPTAAEKYSEVYYITKTPKCQSILDKLPWVLEEYKKV